MRFKCHVAAAGLSAFFVCAEAGATITQVLSPGALTGGPFTKEDFEDDTFEPGAGYSPGTSRITSGAASGGVTPSGVWGLRGLGVTNIEITFSQPTSSVGLWFGNDDTCCSSGFDAHMDIFGSSGLLGTVSLAANMNDFADQFLGFNSDQQVTSVLLRFGAGTPDVGLARYIDDVYFTTPPCGNGALDAGEQCDDGNNTNGDCCSSTCQHESNGSPCTDDGNVCTDDKCDGAGTCEHPNNTAPCDDTVFCNGTDTCSGGSCSTHAGDPCDGPDGDGNCAESCDETADMCIAPDTAGSGCASDGNGCTDDVCDGAGTCGVNNTDPCSDGNACTDGDTCDGGSCISGTPVTCDDGNICTHDSCDPETGCSNDATPVMGCKMAGKSILLLKNNSDDTKDKLAFKWLKGEETTLEQLGTPTGTTNYTLCLYAGTTSASVLMEGGSKWQPLGTKGFKYKDLSLDPDGAQKAKLKIGDAGKAKVLVKGKGGNLPDDLVPPLLLPVTAQLVNDENSTCFEATYASEDDVKKNTEKLFKAKAQ